MVLSFYQIFQYILMLVTFITLNGYASINSYTTFECLKSYENNSNLSLQPAYLGVQTVQKESIVVRFKSFLNTRTGGFFAILIDDFMKQELDSSMKSYDLQLEVMNQKGTDSAFKSQSRLFETHFSTLETKIKIIEQLLAPSMISRLFTRQNARLEKLNRAAEEVAQCRTKFEKCSVNLESAVRESSQNIETLTKLLVTLKNKRAELIELNNHIGENLEIYDPSNSDSTLLLNTYIRQLDQIISNTNSILTMESKSLTLALIKIRTDIPEMKERINDLIAKGAPEAIRKTVEEKSNIELDLKHERNLINKITNIISSTANDKAKLDAIYNLVGSASEIKLDEALLILESIPKNINWGENNPKNEYTRSINSISGKKWTGFFKHELLICYDVLAKTVHNGNSIMGQKLIKLSNSIVNRELKNNKESYQADVLAVFNNLYEKFQ